MVNLRVLIAQAVALVELGKGVEDDVLLVGALRSVAEDGEKHGEVDGAGRLLDHALQLGVGADAAQRVEGGADVVLREEAVLVLVDELEGLLELRHLVLGEPGEREEAGC